MLFPHLFGDDIKYLYPNRVVPVTVGYLQEIASLHGYGNHEA
jgi:hypothetical protein